MFVALIPFRSYEDAKLRLGGFLDAEERASLVGAMLESTVAAAIEASTLDSVCVISPDPGALRAMAEMGAITIADDGRGLNPALDVGRAWALAAGADGLLVLPADLPCVTAASIDAFVMDVTAQRAADERSADVVGIVPDQHGSGTNALLLGPPSVIDFRFGSYSYDAHLDAAVDAGVRVVRSGGLLGFDLDTPEDYLGAERILFTVAPEHRSEVAKEVIDGAGI